MHDYQLLKVRQEGDATIALLPFSELLGMSQTLREDCQRLVQHASCPIVLDLRQVEFVDGWFFIRVLELWRDLRERSIRLTVQLSANLAEIAKITKFDRVLEITWPEKVTES